MTRAVQVFTGEGIDYDPEKLDRVVDLQDWMPVQVRLPYVKIDPYKDNFFIDDVGTFYAMANGRVVRNLIQFAGEGFFTDWDVLGEIVVWTMDGQCYRVKHCWRPSNLIGYAEMVIVGHSITVEDQDFKSLLAESDELLKLGEQMYPVDPRRGLWQILKEHGGLGRNFPAVMFDAPPSMWGPSILSLPDINAPFPEGAEDLADVQPMKPSEEPEESHIPEIDIEITSEKITAKSRKLNVKISGFGIPDDPGPYNGF